MKDADADRIVSEIVSRLRKAREQQALSLNRTAEKAGLTHVGVLNMENGQRSPQLLTVIKIADALGVRLSDLFKDLER